MMQALICVVLVPGEAPETARIPAEPSWLAALPAARRPDHSALPAEPRSGLALGQQPPRGLVVGKMDIEGTEYNLVPRLLHHGLLCHAIDYLSVEWHERLEEPVPRSRPDQRLFPKTREARTQVKEEIKSIVSDGRHGCKLHDLSDVDDETYVNDGRPMPERRRLAEMRSTTRGRR